MGAHRARGKTAATTPISPVVDSGQDAEGEGGELVACLRRKKGRGKEKWVAMGWLAFYSGATEVGGVGPDWQALPRLAAARG
jgi:hypothetical protein